MYVYVHVHMYKKSKRVLQSLTLYSTGLSYLSPDPYAVSMHATIIKLYYILASSNMYVRTRLSQHLHSYTYSVTEDKFQLGLGEFDCRVQCHAHR